MPVRVLHELLSMEPSSILWGFVRWRSFLSAADFDAVQVHKCNQLAVCTLQVLLEVRIASIAQEGIG